MRRNARETVPIDSDSIIPSHKIHTYEYSSNNHDFSLRVPGARTQMMSRICLRDYCRSIVADEKKRYSEPPHDAELIETVAKNFVEQTIGVTAPAPILWRDHEYGEDNTYITGTYHVINNSVSLSKGIDFSTDLSRYMSLVSTAVHEKSHETGRDNRRCIAIIDNSQEVVGATINNGMTSPKIAFDKDGLILTTRNNFYEEGFVEEIASQWREMAIPTHEHVKDTHWTYTFEDQEPIELPRRYWNYSTLHQAKHLDSDNASGAAVAAHALQQLNKIADVDLYRLLVNSRHSDKEVQSKRDFAKAINRIKPGLYKELGELPYSNEGFMTGHKTVKDIIENH